MKDKHTLHIGLCLAGAVSAGAYTAGVIDYLLQALDEWESRKKTEVENVPAHQVKIPVIGGTSAGGMTGLLLAAVKNRNFGPVKTPPEHLKFEMLSNPLYHAWVDMSSVNMIDMLLDCADLENDEPMKSLLNSSFVDSMVERSLQTDNGAVSRRNYFPDPLKVFVTLCNLEGFRFNVSQSSFDPGKYRYMMANHSDLVCFHFSQNNEYANDGWIPVNSRSGHNMPMVKQAAMATGAFPLGLKARTITRPGFMINELEWNKKITAEFPIADELNDALCVDGGIINNEPFEYVRQLLNQITGESHEIGDYNNFQTFKSTVLLIDPFPGEAELFDARDAWNVVSANTFQAMLDQMRIKPIVSKMPFNSNLSGQFMISPVRELEAGQVKIPLNGSSAIACGSLWGFGGFISKEFRIHDFFLGRANCEKFLRDRFVIPEDIQNPIIEYGYKNVEDKDQFRSAINGGLQIIPIFEKRLKHTQLPIFENGDSWPVLDPAELQKIRPMVKKRVDKLLRRTDKLTPLETVLLWIGSRVLLSGKISDAIMSRVYNDLKRHRLLE